jgi:thymidine kinase
MSIHVITGPMFAGKTTELLQKAQRYRYIGSSMLIIKPSLDSRYGNDVMMTHSGIKEHDIVNARELKDLSTKIDKFDILLIDEGQFFTDIYETCLEWRNILKKTIIVSCLDMTSDGLPFGTIGNLFAIADTIQKLKSVCFHCKKDATFSKCLVSKKKQVLLGGVDTYIANCLECFTRTRSDSKEEESAELQFDSDF